MILNIGIMEVKDLQSVFRYITVIFGILVLNLDYSLSEELHYTVREGIPSGHTIGNVPTDARLNLKYTASELSVLQYSFLTQPIENFTINENTGVIKTKGVLDRDTTCKNLRYCEIKLDVAIQPVKYFEIIKVTVEIEDDNDNRPIFDQSVISHDILESALPGNSFIIPTAKDPDSPAFSIQEYVLAENYPQFGLQVTNKVDGSTAVKLLLRQKLDREVKDRYQIQIIAYDGGNPPKSGSIDVNINVFDSNDNPPVFENSTYRVTINENILIGTTILKVTATDKDVGLNGNIQYSFSGQTSDAYGHLFRIDPDKGEITIRGDIDHEKANIYTLTVIAKDSGPDSVPADATVVISVEDINDHKPDITVNTLDDSGTDKAHIVENSNAGTFVAHITVVDKDSGKNGKFNCTLNDSHFELKQMYETEFKIQTTRPLDRERDAQYNLVIICKDQGYEPQTEHKNLKVIVDDANDCQPEFEKKEYIAYIMENNYIGAHITHVNATDCDVGANADIRYFIPDEYVSMFEIEPITGMIKASKSFNRERESIIKFMVSARDKGDPPRIGTAPVEVYIQDTNDELPKFEQDEYSFSVYENEASGIGVGTVAATDFDESPYNRFIYAIVPSLGDEEYFEIIPEGRNMGLISTRHVLDRENHIHNGVYHLIIAAIEEESLGDRRRSSTVPVTIYVEDKNDNPPIFVFPNDMNNTVQLSTQTPRGHLITRVEATDKDVRENAQISYVFQSGNENGIFALDISTGYITLDENVSDRDGERFELYIQAADHGSPRKDQIGILNIVVNKSIPFPLGQAQTALLSGTNFTVVVSLAVASGVITIILVTAIVIIKRQEEHKKVHKYNCRMEALKMLTAKETMCDYEGSSKSSQHLTKSGAGDTSSDCSSVDRHCTKKEVSFSLDMDEASMEQQPSWNSPHQNGGRDRYAAPPHPRSLHRKEVEVHQALGMIKDPDGGDSTYSGDGSNTDSGRGPSEEGGEGHTRAHGEPYYPSHMRHVRPSHLYQQGHLPPIPARPTPQPPPPPSAHHVPTTSNNFYQNAQHCYNNSDNRLQTFGPARARASPAPIPQADNKQPRLTDSVQSGSLDRGRLTPVKVAPPNAYNTTNSNDGYHSYSDNKQRGYHGNDAHSGGKQFIAGVTQKDCVV